MKKLYFLLFSAVAVAQCPVGNVNITSQAQLNAFATNYPTCTTIAGDVDLHGNDIVDLSPLANIQTVNGHFWVYSCNALTSLDGLNLSSVGSIDVSYNAQLSSIAALDGITAVPGNVSLQVDPALQSLSGLQNLATIGGLLSLNGDGISNVNGLSGLTSLGFFLEIKNNPNLTSVDGLLNLQSLANNGYLEVSGNAALTTLQGLNNIDPTTINALTINNNPQLAFCSIPNICYFIANIGGGTVFNNASGCNTGVEITTVCDLSTDDFSSTLATVWPNPTNGIVHFELTEPVASIEVFDAIGRRILISSETKVDLSQHPSGVYLYRISSDGKSQTGKIVKP